MQNFDRKILYDLYKSGDGLYVYTFYERYKLDPEKIFKFIEKYESQELIIYKNDKLFITEKGKSAVQKKKIDWPYGVNRFENIPSEYLGEKMDIDQPYIPDFNNLSNEILDL